MVVILLDLELILPTEALDISGNLKVSGQILSVDGDDFSTVVPITQQQTTTENPTWHG